jgi:hypothetical protein
MRTLYTVPAGNRGWAPTLIVLSFGRKEGV